MIIRENAASFVRWMLVAVIFWGGIVNAQTQQELIANAGFEQGYSSWTCWGDFQIAALSYPHNGSYYASISGDNKIGTMYQQFSIPSNATAVTLSYYYNISSAETGSSPYDLLDITLQNSSGSHLASIKTYNNSNKGSAGSYGYAAFNLINFKGQTIRLHFLGTTDASNATTFRIDDVHCVATIPAEPPDAPSNLVAAGSGNAILLGWADNSSNEDGFHIQRKTGSSGTYQTIHTNSAGVKNWSDNTAVAGTIYYYRVSAYKGSLDSGYSNEDSAVALAKPTLSYPGNGSVIVTSSVNLQWNSVTSAEAYTINMGTSSGGTDVLNGYAVDTNHYLISLPNGTYYWKVRAANLTHGGLSLFSTESNFTVIATTPRIRISPLTLTFTR